MSNIDKFTLKDSGARVEFETGSRRDTDEDKMRPDLSGWELIVELAPDLVSYDTDTWVDFERYIRFGDWERATRLVIRMFVTRELRTRLANHMALGANRYGDYNWQLGQDKERYKRSAIRHFWQWVNGLNPEEDHLSATLFNLFAPYWTAEYGPGFAEQGGEESNE